VAEQTRRVVIDARVGDGEFRGSARDEFGEPKPFRGWLELLAALDWLLDGSTVSAGAPAVRVCVAFASADQANAFAASASLRDAITEADSGSAPELWFTHAQSEGTARQHSQGKS
jgi:hypothetical protein